MKQKQCTRARSMINKRNRRCMWNSGSTKREQQQKQQERKRKQEEHHHNSWRRQLSILETVGCGSAKVESTATTNRTMRRTIGNDMSPRASAVNHRMFPTCVSRDSCLTKCKHIGRDLGFHARGSESLTILAVSQQSHHTPPGIEPERQFLSAVTSLIWQVMSTQRTLSSKPSI